MSGDLKRLATIARPVRDRLAAAAALQALTIASGVGLVSTSAWLLSKAALHPSIAALQVAIVGVRAFGISRATLRYVERLLSHDVTLRLLGRLRTFVYRGLVPLAPARLLDHRRGDLLGRLLDDVGTLEAFYARLLGPSLAALGAAAVVAAILWAFDPALPPVALAGLLAAGVLAPAVTARAAEAPGRRLVAARARLSARAVDGVHGVADLVAFGGEEAHARALHDDGLAAIAEQVRLARASALGNAAVVVAADLTAVGVLAVAVPAVRAGSLDGVSLATAVLATVAAFEAVAPLTQAWHALGATRAAARRIFSLVDERPAVSEPDGPLPEPVAGAPLVEVRGLRFTYPGETRPALDGVDLRLERGHRVAVVGTSGSGKSTLVHLLLRFLAAPPGTVFLEGHDLSRWPSDAARERIAFSAQRAHVFTGTLRDNLRLAKPDATDAELADALAAVGFGAGQGPVTLDAGVGEEGQRLSGGERQRLALARALLRPAPLLLLDEPTAHLDALTEREVLGVILRAGEGRGTLLVTHRLVGLEAFDEVLVLDGGRVAERGTAAELEARGGALARLLSTQRSVEALGDLAFRASGADGLSRGLGRTRSASPRTT